MAATCQAHWHGCSRGARHPCVQADRETAHACIRIHAPSKWYILQNGQVTHHLLVYSLYSQCVYLDVLWLLVGMHLSLQVDMSILAWRKPSVRPLKYLSRQIEFCCRCFQMLPSILRRDHRAYTLPLANMNDSLSHPFWNLYLLMFILSEVYPFPVYKWSSR